MSKYIIDLLYGKHGLPYVKPEPGARLLADQDGRTFTIRGNAEGLLLLARSLVALAEMKTTPENEGYHIHLDELFDINSEGIEFILRRD